MVKRMTSEEILPYEKNSRQTFSVNIPAPMEIVWEVVYPMEDFAEVAPDFNKIEFLSDRKVGIGATMKWHGVGLWWTASARIEVITEYKRHQYFSYRTVSGDPPRYGTILFLPYNEGVQVIFTVHFLYDVTENELAERKLLVEEQLQRWKHKSLGKFNKQS